MKKLDTIAAASTIADKYKFSDTAQSGLRLGLDFLLRYDDINENAATAYAECMICWLSKTGDISPGCNVSILRSDLVGIAKSVLGFDTRLNC